MKKVITYGTYDFLHHGHINLLKNAKALGDYLIVGITSDEYDRSRGKIDVRQTLPERMAAVEATGLADEIIVEEYEGQKIADIQKYGVDIFTVGSDWVGKFDYLNEFCEVVYLPRTQGVSSTQIRKESNRVVRMGVLGSRNPSLRFLRECQQVNGAEAVGLYSDNAGEAAEVAEKAGLTCFASREALYEEVDAVYIIDRLDRHAALIREALEKGKHVICEGPLFLHLDEAKSCYDYAKEHGLILLDAVKTRYFPGYRHMLLLLKSGKIGKIKDIEVSFSQKLSYVDYKNLNKYEGSLYDLGGYIFLPIIQLLGRDYEQIHIFTSRENDFDVFTKGILKYKDAVASFKAGLGVKTEGQLIITGEHGYVYVPAPWWKTDYFEIRYEDLRDTKKYFWQYEGEGFRYEIMEFLRRINNRDLSDEIFHIKDSLAITKLLEDYDNGNYSLF
ncbi:MAG: Gfo/Idh/MocA family oxidoreductase [Clostridia bacterium]|nr:Gfo/Idh/MocA family oxidoreductase [Clostridia bacterium]